MFLVSFIVIAAWMTVAVSANFKSGCKFGIDRESSIQIWNDEKLVVPSEDSVTKTLFVSVTSGSFLTFECQNSVEKFEIQCVLGQVVRTSIGIKNFQEFECKKLSLYKETVSRNGTCHNEFTNIEIVLRSGEASYKFVSACHNEITSETIFVKSIIRGPDLKHSEPITRSSFKEAGFYPDIPVDNCYKQVSQLATVTELVGSKELAEKYIRPKERLFLARGHLSPNGDGIEAYEKKATFYFINIVGQWQTINGGNWNKLENVARKIADTRQAFLTVYTGGYGVTRLEDINGNLVEIWLGRDESGILVKKLPVPHLLWKVIHDEERNDGVAIIMVNNPWLELTEDDILCKNICDKLNWVHWNISNQNLGYTYCCDVDSFFKAVAYAPNLGSLPLLQQDF